MVGRHLSEQARRALRTAHALARDRGHPAPGSAQPLLAAILGQWMTSTPVARCCCAPAA
jgi:hypothetical protein